MYRIYYTIRRSKDGKYWWRAIGDNNKIMAASELMESKQSCLSAIVTMKSEALLEPRTMRPARPLCAVRSRQHHDQSG